MPKNISPESTAPHDPDNPVWTRERMANAMRFNELPEGLRNKLSAIQEESRRKRGLQKAPTKQPVTIRLSADVLVELRGKGRGWQTLVDQTLREKFLKAKA